MSMEDQARKTGKDCDRVICSNFQDVHPDELTASKTPGYPSSFP